jgi:hypothetical protein
MATKKTAAASVDDPRNSGATAGSLIIPPLNLRRAVIRVVGDTLLCTHPFSEKARRLMLEAQGPNKVKAKKEPRDPEADYEASKYLDAQGRCCVRAIAFKSAAVDAATQFDKSITKVFLRGVFHIPAELLPIEGEPRMRQDMVRVGMGTADIRFRAEFFPWAINVPVRYNAGNISLASLVELFRMGGYSCGIAEYRPQRDGNWGMFSVESVLEDREEQ